jgi:hypothetical protein
MEQKQLSQYSFSTDLFEFAMNTARDKTVKHKSGYVYQLCPNHPRCDIHGRVLQHRLVMEKKLGRFLYDWELVHHLNGQKDDNHPDNLEVAIGQNEHMKRHSRRYNKNLIAQIRKAAANPNLRLIDLPCSPTVARWICKHNDIEWLDADKVYLTEEQVTAALVGRTTKEAAEYLGVSGSTLYRLFPRLLTKRNAPGFLDQNRKEICNLAMTMPVKYLCMKFDTNRTTLNQAFRRWKEAGVLPIALVSKLNADRHRKNKL